MSTRRAVCGISTRQPSSALPREHSWSIQMSCWARRAQVGMSCVRPQCELRVPHQVFVRTECAT
eukprot:7162521-Pyramimonas_sp.AAC.1